MLARKNVTAVVPTTSRNPRRTPISAKTNCQSGGSTNRPRPFPTKMTPVAAPRRDSNQRGTTDATTTYAVPIVSPRTANTIASPTIESRTYSEGASAPVANAQANSIRRALKRAPNTPMSPDPMNSVNSITANTPESATGGRPKVSLNGSRKMPYESAVPNVKIIATAPIPATTQLWRLSGRSARSVCTTCARR